MNNITSLIKYTGSEHDGDDPVGVSIGGRTSIFQVPLLFLRHVARNSYGTEPVSHTCNKLIRYANYQVTELTPTKDYVDL